MNIKFYTHMRYSFLLLFVLIFSIQVQSQSTNFVELRDGTRIVGKVEIEEPFLMKARAVVNDTTEILLQDVQKYQTDDGYFVRMSGGLGDAFARRIEEGNIDLFTRTIESYSGGWMPGPNGTMTYMGGGFNSSQVEYFSKDEGPILRANAINLKKAMTDNPLSMEYLNKRDGLTAVQVIGVIGGIAIAGATISSQADKESPDFTGAVVGALVIGGSAWIPHFAKKDLTQKAIQEYNNPTFEQ